MPVRSLIPALTAALAATCIAWAHAAAAQAPLASLSLRPGGVSRWKSPCLDAWPRATLSSCPECSGNPTNGVPLIIAV